MPVLDLPRAEWAPAAVCAGPVEYEIQGHTRGTGAVMRVFGGGFAFLGFNNNYAAQFQASYLFDSCAATKYGKDYRTQGYGNPLDEDYEEPDPLLLIIPATYVRTPDTNVFLRHTNLACLTAGRMVQTSTTGRKLLLFSCSPGMTEGIRVQVLGIQYQTSILLIRGKVV